MKNYSSDECPYFRKITFKKMELLNINSTAREWDVSDEPESSEQIQSSLTEDQIPQQGTTNKIKIYQYHSAEQFASIPSDGCIEEEKQNPHQQIIQIKMPKIFKSRGLCEKLNNTSCPKKMFGPIKAIDHRDFQKQDAIQELQEEQWCQNFQLEEQGEINQIYSGKTFPRKKNVLMRSFSGFIKLFKEKQTKLCFIFLDRQSLKLSSKHSKYPDMTHIDYFISLRKYRLVFQDLQDPRLLQINIISKNHQDKLKIEFQDDSREIFKNVYREIRESPKIERERVQKQNQSLMSSVSSVDSYYLTVQRVKIDNIQAKLDNFDIILFKGKSVLCKMQRFFTNSNFDHVGMILKTYDGEILMLEATGNAGVAIYSFASMKKALEKKFYDKIAIRKLMGLSDSFSNLKSNCIKKLQKFVKKANGKQYKFDPRYLLWPKSKPRQNQESKLNCLQKQQTIEQTYFCSQLVAEALKFCGILQDRPEKPSCSYLPRNFGDIDGLNDQLCPGFCYSELILLQI